MENASAFNYFMTESLSYRNQMNGPVSIWWDLRYERVKTGNTNLNDFNV